MKRNLDPIDRRILNVLQAHGRLSIVDLAERVHLTKTPCSERVKRLERDGVIKSYGATLDPAEVGMGHVMIVHVNLSKTSDSSLEDFNRAVKQIPEVQTCLMIAGPFDYMLKVRTRDITHFRELLGERISQLPAVMQTHSYAVMETVKETAMIELSS
ncbi:MAG: Lrp/AsnC ligand binding domain-containing protein [Hoeflea sp.]|uniref:Lrp/AsnC family transcriptional regulator n=1 Tax=Hoeflea sp. TaxID=1940281 RepID=UPI001D84DF0C|nr:Lrp/AsnC ligand binding domain-containing protein [Hoeflea sp.]MBU4527378.1 Lrp/AsnC ligand binding domain-containing protein [Alphaproteobacteria bacterium]MBU4546839.1 Lrp/AsnC ligand binding domain-containing protein [Alphaproteobacteria bacterium]MBU4551649.1 Lrp/AsnC ligand binding domain-containing protein [Alphaproteobacteria bacterium]MBV1725654.1 Lrp/AsnC ligand binding domain-containing protein [Hoeflea sp.]MBV1759702.1 Lrp/AsnC ligand binding domain-containing protein [Hoeflea sp